METRRIVNIFTTILLFIAIFLVSLPVSLITAKAADDYSGTYYLESGLGSGIVLDVTGGKTVNRTNVQIYKRNGSTAQQFSIKKYGSYYYITNVKSGKVLDVAGASKSNKANLQIYTWNKTKAQLWKIQSAGSGYYYFVNAGSGKALDVAGGKTANGTNVWQYTLNRTKAQKWKLIKATTTGSSVARTKQSAQTKGITSGTVYTITSAVGRSFALEVNGGSKSDGANAQLYMDNGSAAQRWKIIWDGGYYRIVNVNSGKSLDVSGGKCTNGTNVQQWSQNGTLAQKWKIVKNSDGTYTFVSGLWDNAVLDVKSAKPSNRQNVQIWKSNGSKAQKWYITKYSAEQEIPSGFTNGFEYGQFSKFNSLASKNGLGETKIWITGTYDGIMNIDVSTDGIEMNAFCAIFKDADGRKWLVQLGVDYFESKAKFEALKGHRLCVIGRYTGYSQVYNMPVCFVKSIFDRKNGSIVSSTWYELTY